MMKRLTTALFFSVYVLSACASTQPIATGNDTFVLPDMPSEPAAAQGIPYPALNEQTQIDHLGIQIARLEREINQLQTRIQQLERRNTSAVRTTKTKSAAPQQRLSDSKLKSQYLAGNNSPAATAYSADDNELRLYNQAIKHYQSGNFAGAAAVLKGADGGNGSDVARRNMYLLLQSQQRLGNCESVIEIGGRYANRFRGTEQAPEALFSIAQCQYQMQQKDIARVTWRKLIQTYPDSSAAKRAVIRIKQR